MVTFYFRNTDDGRTYFVRGPSTLTKLEAERVFQQQKSSGALIGLKPGQKITAESQLLNGLIAAKPAVLGVGNSAARPLSLTRPAVQPPVLSDVFRPAVETYPVIDGINLANYSKQPPASAPIKKITASEVTGLLAQVRNLTKQNPTEATNLGAGKYALTVQQLERAGYIKPATTVKYLMSGIYSTLTVLKMLEVWTGKDTVVELNVLLNNSELQDTIQQFLMFDGLEQLAEVGINTDNLPASEQGGLALLAAIDPNLAKSYVSQFDPTVVDSLQATVIPSRGPLPLGTTKEWLQPNVIVRDGAYAVEFSKNKTNKAMRNEVPDQITIEPSVQRQQLNFACGQIVGNKKVPEITFGPQAVLPALVQMLEDVRTLYQNLKLKIVDATDIGVLSSSSINDQKKLQSLRQQVQDLLNIELKSLLLRATVDSPAPTEFIEQIYALRAAILTLLLEVDRALQIVDTFINRPSNLGQTQGR